MLIGNSHHSNSFSCFHDFLEVEFEAARAYKPNKADWLDGRGSGFETAPDDDRRGDTRVSISDLQKVGQALSTIPEGFNAHRTVRRLMAAKKEAKGYDIESI